MADKSFGVKELNLLNASGTPTVTSPNNLNLNANTVAISTSATVGNNLTVTSTTNSTNLNVTGIGTLTRGFATDLSVSGISTISQPSNANPHSLWDVVNNGASAYRFTGPGQDGAEDNPNIYLVRGQRYIFKVNASGHPFQLRVANGGAAYSDGVTNNGAQSGNVVINVQHDAPAQLYYQCTNHGGMVGNIYIVGGPQVISGVVTATTFSGSGASLTNLPSAQLTGALPAIDGSNLTGLSGVSLANGADNRVVTATGAAALTGESGLLFTGTNLGIGNRTSSPDQLLHVHTSSGDAVIHVEAGADPKLRLRAHSGESIIQFADASSSNTGEINYVHSGDYLKFRVNASERLRITSTGEIKQYGFTGTSDTSADDLVLGNTTGGVNRGITIWSNSSQNGSIAFADNDSNFRGAVQYLHNGDIMRLLTAGNERIRINSSGQVGIGRDTDPLNSVKLMVQNGSDNVFYAYHEGTGNNYTILCRNDRAVSSTQATQIIFLGSGNTYVGDIKSNGSTTSYNQSSDYRLKENITAISDGITRLKTLKPSRFNFKVDKDTTVDGFLAHEVTAVPEAISGTKDEVVTQAMIDNGDAPSDSKLGDPIYQQIDQAKLVPLLTAALQEAIAKIETLESKVATLEGS